MTQRVSGINPLSYMGVEPTTPPQLVFYRRDPTPNDWQNFQIGCIWINTVTEIAYMLMSLSRNVAAWEPFTGSAGSVINLTGDVGTATPSAGSINIAGGSNINTVAAAHAVTVNLNDNVTITGDFTTTAGAYNGQSINGAAPSGYSTQQYHGAGGAVLNGDFLGYLALTGFDGATFKLQSTIYAKAVTNGAGLGTNFQIQTSPSIATGPLERIRVEPTGEVLIQAPDSGIALTIKGQEIVVSHDPTAPSGYGTEQFHNAGGAAVVNGDNLGYFNLSGFDGAGFALSSAIIATTRTVGAGLGTDMAFYTTPAIGTGRVERMRIQPQGTVIINAPAAGDALDAAGVIQSTSLFVTNDVAPTVAGTLGVTNTNDLTAPNGIGVFTILSKSANNLNSSGFIKIYVGATHYYIPIFSTDTP
jgi:hypothetical protein